MTIWPQESCKRLVALLFVLGAFIEGLLVLVFYFETTDEPRNSIVWKMGDTVYFYGEFDHGITNKLSEHLDDNDTLVIGSGGGRTIEGYRMSELLRELDTKVIVDEMGCWSACSIAVAYQELSGPGVIGIHGVSIGGKQNFITRWFSDVDLKEHYVDAGRTEWADVMDNATLDFVEFSVSK